MTARKAPDALMLDRMVLGTDDPHDVEDRAAWMDLLADPDADRAWQLAVERRAQVDQFAAVLAEHPWLAAPLLTARRATRRAISVLAWPGAHAAVETLSLEAMLGTDAPASVTFSIAPGDHRVIEASLGSTVRFDLPVGTVLREQKPDGLHELGDITEWRLDPDESPVMLVLERAIDEAPMAVVVLIESSSMKATP